ncbi:hypothetical protein KEM52_000638 [Ascosphaera acerosa]|nr:hypothetical protein KEM52_000638 [Ascosphaera acerosa]
MVNSVLFWGGFGVLARMWQLGIQKRPIVEVPKLWVYGLFGGLGGTVGYWLQGVEDRQLAMLAERKAVLLAKRARQAAREQEGEESGAAVASSH